MTGKIIFYAIFMFLTGSCLNKTGEQRIIQKPGNNEMAELNRYLVQKDREIIENYIERKNLKMTESSGGLWYLIINEGNGTYFKDNDIIKMNYECQMLDGTICYTSNELGPKQIILGRTDIEPGLNEGLRLLNPGAEALFILPPFLAFGLIGDGNKIPPRTIIVYRIKIIDDN
jgi:FKBP-type peptidyl-prolyl cis-trans isomerase